MPIINSQVKPFKATAYKNGSFVEVSDADLKGIVDSPSGLKS